MTHPGAVAASSPIRVAIIQDFTGAGGAGAAAQAKGINLGFKNFGSRVNGRPISVKYFDAASDPSVALSQARAAVDSFHADVILGPSIASDEAAISPYVASIGIPMDDQGLCSLPQIQMHEKPSVMIYSSTWSCDTPSLIAAKWAYEVKKWRHMTLIGQDYAFGWLTVGQFKAVFTKLGGKIDKVIWVPFTALDFSSYVTAIPKDTQAVYAEISGGASSRFISAYAQFGLKGKIPVLGAVTLTDQSVLPAMSASDAVGTYMTANYCDGIDSRLNNYFVKQYLAKNGTYPGYYSEAGYTKVRILLNAFKRLGGDVSDKKKLGAALMAINMAGPRGPVKLDRQYKAPVQNMYVCQVKSVKGVLRNVPVKTYTNVPLWGPLSKAEWRASFEATTKGRPG